MSIIDTRVVNIDELKLEHATNGNRFESNSVRIGALLGAKALGYSYDVVPPGKRSCPFHSHRGEEEMFFIVRGEGTLRYGEETRKLRFDACEIALDFLEREQRSLLRLAAGIADHPGAASRDRDRRMAEALQTRERHHRQ